MSNLSPENTYNLTGLASYEALLELAQKDPNYDRKCWVCKTHIVYSEDTEARGPGHIYSEAGLEEFTNISGVCEYCFDDMFAEEEED